MNYKVVLNVLGKVMLIACGFLCVPLLIALIYGEYSQILGFLVAIIILLALGLPSIAIKTQDRNIYAKEGFVIVALVWILLSLIGALPFVVNAEIPNYVNALFETVSGFTTTGSSILSGAQIESMSKTCSFWRCFTHFIGGMGVLVFVLAVLPQYNNGVMHLFKTEAPGPTASKFVGKLRRTARILYGIYCGLTLIEIIMLLFGGMNLFDAVIHAFSTAGTGGFSNKGDSIAYFNSVYIEMVIATFMLLFGINFNFFYFILIGQFAKAIKSEEIRVYLLIVILSVVFIALNLISVYGDFLTALRYSYFQTTAISSTTGFASADFNSWPTFSKTLILFLMIIGACGGSTCGGFKISRGIILTKTCWTDLKRTIRPRVVISAKFEKELLSQETINTAKLYLYLWLIIIFATTLLLSIEGNDILTNLTASLTCISNVGPGLSKIGPAFNFAFFSPYSKILLCLVMLAGRLEIIPIFVLLNPKTWKKK